VLLVVQNAAIVESEVNANLVPDLPNDAENHLDIGRSFLKVVRF
jgi:hypothetical protein